MISTQPTLTNFAQPIRHPARYSDALLPVMAQYLKRGMCVLDPFGGVGTINRLSHTGATFFTGEIEYRVCEHSAGKRRVCADAQMLPFASESFDAVCTSPTYGNRMADTALTWKQTLEFNTYDRAFGFKLHEQNSGRLNWGAAYRRIHINAYLECWELLKPSGLMIVNISDHIRDYKRVYVSAWHYKILRMAGFKFHKLHFVRTPRLTQGTNHELRTAGEYIFVFRKP